MTGHVPAVTNRGPGVPCARANVVAGLAILVMGAGTARARAQSNDEVFPQVRWNFSTPGARASGMGGAFTGVADDASTAITNPAGLLSLTRPQIDFEFKTAEWRVEHLAAPSSLFTLNPTTSEKTVGFPSLLNLSMPIGNRFAVGFSRHEFLYDEESFTLDPRPVPGDPVADVLFPVNGQRTFMAAAYAGSFAMRVTNRLRAGVTVSANHLTAEATATRFGFLRSDASNASSLTSNGIVNDETVIDGGSTSAGLVAGALYTVNDRLTVGAQFTRAPSFTLSEDKRFNPGAGAIPATNATLVSDTAHGFPIPVRIDVPNRLAAGVGYRANERLLVAFDAVYVGYGRLAKHTAIVFAFPGLDASAFAIDHVVEVHAGAEYLLMSRPGRRLFVRAGVYTNPDHMTKFLGIADPEGNAVETAIYNLLPRTTQVVGTIGAGFVFGRTAQADVAYLSSREFVASIGARF